jgi:hypothetical protein
MASLRTEATSSRATVANRHMDNSTDSLVLQEVQQRVIVA